MCAHKHIIAGLLFSLWTCPALTDVKIAVNSEEEQIVFAGYSYFSALHTKSVISSFYVLSNGTILKSWGEVDPAAEAAASLHPLGIHPCFGEATPETFLVEEHELRTLFSRRFLKIVNEKESSKSMIPKEEVLKYSKFIEKIVDTNLGVSESPRVFDVASINCYFAFQLLPGNFEFRTDYHYYRGYLLAKDNDLKYFRDAPETGMIVEWLRNLWRNEQQ